MNIIKVVNFAITDSTQVQAKIPSNTVDLKNPGECMLFSANEQTAGQGTNNRQWASPPSVNIYATYAYLADPKNDKYLPNIAQVAAVSVMQTLQEYGLSSTFKWPNDVLLNQRKTCGILPQSDMKDGHRIIYLGIGLNVNMTSEELEKPEYAVQLRETVTSMRMTSGSEYNKDEILLKLNERLMKNITKLYSNGFSEFANFINSAFETFNNELRWIDLSDSSQGEHEYIQANILKMLQDGSLQLKMRDGSEKIVFSARLLKDDEVREAERLMATGRLAANAGLFQGDPGQKQAPHSSQRPDLQRN